MIADIYAMQIVCILALIGQAVTLAVFAFKTRAIRAEVRKWRAETVDLTLACGALLASHRAPDIRLHEGTP